jgi:hypothetical protein
MKVKLFPSSHWLHTAEKVSSKLLSNEHIDGLNIC